MTMPETPRERNRAAEVLAAAYPDLSVKEVRRLLCKAQEVKRDEIAELRIERNRGATLEVNAFIVA